MKAEQSGEALRQIQGLGLIPEKGESRMWFASQKSNLRARGSAGACRTKIGRKATGKAGMKQRQGHDSGTSWSKTESDPPSRQSICKSCVILSCLIICQTRMFVHSPATIPASHQG